MKIRWLDSRLAISGRLTLLVVLGLVSNASAQLRLFPSNELEEGESRSTIVTAPRDLRTSLDEAKQLLQSGQTVAGLNLLQKILDQPEDYFLDRELRGSMKSAATELLLAQPASVRQAYELQHNAAALHLHQLSQQTGNRTAKADLFRRYSATTAGQTAALKDARDSLDRGEAVAAGRWWRRIQELAPTDLPTEQVLTAALSWLLAERVDLAAEALQHSSLTAGDRWQLGANTVQIPESEPREPTWLLRQLPGMVPLGPLAVAEWQAPRGDSQQNAGARRCGPVGAFAWSTSTFNGYPNWREAFGLERRPASEIEDLALQLMEGLRLDGKLTQPAMSPLVVDDRVIVRTPFEVAAHHLRDGRLLWRSRLRNSGLADAWSLRASNLESDDNRNLLETEQRQAALQEWLLRNQNFGHLVTSNGLVYALEHAPHVPESTFVMIGGAVERPAVHNSLVAYDLHGGRLIWEFDTMSRTADGGTTPHYVLGPPLCLEDQLFCLIEAEGEIRLVQLENSQTARGPRLFWSQVLAAPRVDLSMSPIRRLSGITPAAAGDLLICPTTAGLVVAVDVARQELAWGYEYPSLESTNFMDPRQIAIARLQGRATAMEVDENDGRWLSTSPIIGGGHVVVTPRDSSELHCLDVVTGKLAWKRNRDQGLFIAGIREQQVIVVNRDFVESLSLKTGESLWQAPVPIAEPSGLGLFVDQVYLLPLVTGEIVAIDWQDGQIRTRTRLSQGKIPGNLAAGHGSLISQSYQEVLAYQSLPVIEQQIAETLLRDPNDVAALALRGELRLHQGDDASAVIDLRKALSFGKNAQASLVLVDLSMARLRREFPADRKEIDELEQLIEDDHQRTEFLSLTAQGFERRGELQAAFEQYLKLSTSTVDRHPLTRLSNDLTVRRDRMIRGRLQGLFAVASPSDRAKMHDDLRRRMEAAAHGSEVERLRFLNYLEGLPYAEEVWLDLLQNQPMALRRSTTRHEWARLSTSRQPRIAALASMHLAEEALASRNFQAAKNWVARIQSDYANVDVGQGVTGAQWLQRRAAVLSNLATDNASGWPLDMQPYRSRRTPVLQRRSAVELMGLVAPDYEDWVFDFEEGPAPALVARDGRGAHRWTLMLPAPALQNQVHFGTRRAAPQLWNVGTRFALSLGTSLVMFECTTPDSEPRLTWNRSLLPATTSPFQQSSITVHAEYMRSGRRRIRAVEADADLQIGQLIGLTSQQVVYQIADRIIAADLETGAVLWSRYDIPRQIEGRANDETVMILDTISQEAWLLRAADGHLLLKRNVPDPHQWVHFSGSHLLTLASVDQQLQLQQINMSTGIVEWSQALTGDERHTSLRTGEIASLNSRGHWQIRNATTGQPIAKGTSAAFPQLEFFWAQREGEGYLMVGGINSPPDSMQGVIVYDGNQVPIHGAAFFVVPNQPQPRWTVELNSTAFHVIQPASVPVLAFAGRVVSRSIGRPTGVTNIAKLSAIFIDRRTGDVLYETMESPAAGLFQWEINGEDQELTANFLSFSIQFRRPPADALPAGAAQDN